MIIRLLFGAGNAARGYALVLVGACLFFCFAGKALADAPSGGGTVPIAEIRRRRIVEKNGIADAMCLMVSIMRSDISRALVSISLFAMGVGAFFGKLSFGWFFAFVLGTAGFFASTSIIAIIVPFSDIGEGCNCKTSLALQRDDSGNLVSTSSFLSRGCDTLDDPNH